MSEAVADDILRAGYQRWLRLEEEKAAIGDDLKELFAELKVQGFTPKPLRESFRRVRNIDDANQQEHDAIVDLYVASLTRGTRAYTHESSEQDSGGQAGASAAVTTAPAEGAAEETSATTTIPEAKASEDNGATVQDIEAHADSVTGDASRASVGAGTDAPKHRAMRMTPLEPREAGGLKGFGFSVHFDDVNSSPTSSPETKADGSTPPESSATPDYVPAFLAKARHPLTAAETRPHCQNPKNCASYKVGVHCHTCKMAAGLVEAA